MWKAHEITLAITICCLVFVLVLIGLPAVLVCFSFWYFGASFGRHYTICEQIRKHDHRSIR